MPQFDIYSLESEVLGRKRKVRVWLPDEYLNNPNESFPLLIQQDGQIAFSNRDEELPFGSWGLDEWMMALLRKKSIRPAIVVGIDNSPQRVREYFPVHEKFFLYEQFIHDELLPWTRENHRVADGPENTMLMGSSMGGLVSFALAANRPDVFGATACLSPWFESKQNQYIHDVLRPMMEKPNIRVYLDSGILDWRGLDDGYRGMLLVRQELYRLGFEDGKDFDWHTDTWFPTDEDLKNSHVNPDKWTFTKTNQHTEYQWRMRLDRVLKFLLG
jgi:neopullulanase